MIFMQIVQQNNCLVPKWCMIVCLDSYAILYELSLYFLVYKDNDENNELMSKSLILTA